MKLNVVYNKSCQCMPELPDNSIDMIMTSCPYWGLRNYGDDVKEIWGGDPNCEHEFENYARPAGGGHANPDKAQVGATKKDIQRVFGAKAAFCQKCGAWQGQLGLEPTFQLYLDHMVIVCAEIKRVLKKTGSFWLNMGDTYSGSGKGYGSVDPKYISQHSVRNEMRPQQFEVNLPSKCLLGIPWRLVLRLIDEQGWILRNSIIWHKPNAMPSSVKDRCSNSYEFLFHLVKAKKYYYDLDAIREPHAQSGIERAKYKLSDSKSSSGKSSWCQTKDNPDRKLLELNPSGKNPSDVWLIPTQPRPEAHFATFPDKLCIKPIFATCPQEICKKCGKARVRITKSHTSYESGSGKSGNRPKGKYKDLEGTGLIGKNLRMGPTSHVETIGWTDCHCGEGFDSGALLDPFAGRGTSLIMAKKLGRHYVGYELKKEYADMAERELDNIDPLFRKNRD